jgi:hypothetical protein
MSTAHHRWVPPATGYQRYEVVWMRLLFSFVVWFSLPVFDKFPDQPEPNGLASLGIDFTWAGDPALMGTLKMILIPALALYVWGRLSWLTLPYLFVLSLGVGTLKNSQGAISHVYQIVTFVLMAQCGWALYLGVRRLIGKPHHYHGGWTSLGMEVFVSQSAVAAIYLTTAITKLIRSEGAWIWDLRKVGVDLEKTWSQDYYNNLSHDAPRWAEAIRNLVTEHPMLAVVLFGPGLLAEFFAFLGLYGRRWSLALGLLLIILHLGAIYVMRLTFEQNIACLLIFFVNLPYWINRILHWSSQRSALARRKVVQR